MQSTWRKRTVLTSLYTYSSGLWWCVENGSAEREGGKSDENGDYELASVKWTDCAASRRERVLSRQAPNCRSREIKASYQRVPAETHFLAVCAADEAARLFCQPGGSYYTFMPARTGLPGGRAGGADQRPSTWRCGDESDCRHSNALIAAAHAAASTSQPQRQTRRTTPRVRRDRHLWPAPDLACTPPDAVRASTRTVVVRKLGVNRSGNIIINDDFRPTTATDFTTHELTVVNSIRKTSSKHLSFNLFLSISNCPITSRIL